MRSWPGMEVREVTVSKRLTAQRLNFTDDWAITAVVSASPLSPTGHLCAPIDAAEPYHRGLLRGSDAFASAQMLAAAADSALAGARPWKEALIDYQRRRDDATANGFRLTMSAAALKPLPAHLRGYYEAASRRPETVTRIIGALGGVIPVDDVYSAEAIESGVGS